MIGKPNHYCNDKKFSPQAILPNPTLNLEHQTQSLHPQKYDDRTSSLALRNQCATSILVLTFTPNAFKRLAPDDATKP